MNPLARRADVIVQQVGPDTLVYDELRDKAHSLNSVTAYVYEHADGTRSVEEIAAQMGAALDMEADLRVAQAALWQLEQVHLLDIAADGAAHTVSRREAVRRFGTALAAAAVTSIVAPTPAMARSAGGIKPPGHKGPPPGQKGPPPGQKGPPPPGQRGP